MADKKLSSLSKKDMDNIPKFVDKWVKIGLQTGPANRQVVEAAIVEAYKVVDLAPPKTIEWYDSPYAGGKRVKQLLGKDNNNSIFNDVVYGQHDADWMAFYDFFDNCEGMSFPEIKKIYPLMTIAKEVGWWWPFDEACIFTERPVEIHLDQANRLHGEEGMALRYADNWGVYAWHGYRIPTKHHWIIKDKQKLTPELIEKEGNAELRRIMLEIFGFGRYLEERKGKLLGEDKDGAGNERKLWEITVNNERMRIIELNNSSLEPDGSRRKFHLGAMPGNTPHEAVAASFGVNPNYYDETAVS